MTWRSGSAIHIAEQVRRRANRKSDTPIRFKLIWLKIVGKKAGPIDRPFAVVSVTHFALTVMSIRFLGKSLG